MNGPQPFSADTLLQHEPFVRAVARGILSDDALAQDVVQETWLTALLRPPRQGTGGASLRAWLGGVARNLARDSRRRSGRRRMREEKAARPEAIESVAQTQERLEAQREVVDVVLALREPYRSVLLLRYFQDLSTGQIAERLERSSATVRSQLSRGHELVRAALDTRFDGGRDTWSALLLPLLLVPDSPRSIRPLLRSTTARLTLAIAGAATVAFVFLTGEPGTDRASVATAPVAAEATTRSLPGRESAELAAAPGEPGEPEIRRAAVATADAGTREDRGAPQDDPVVRGRLHYDGARLPNEGLQVVVSNLDLGSTRSESRQLVTTDTTGVFEIRSPLLVAESLDRSVKLILSTRGPAETSLHAELELPSSPLSGVHEVGDVVVPVPPHAVSGVVVSSGGEPLPGVAVKATSKPSGEPAGLFSPSDTAIGRAGPSGDFSLYHAFDASWTCRVTAHLPGYLSATVEFVPGQRGVVIELEPEAVSGAGVLVEGSVLLDASISPSGLVLFLERERSAIGMRLDEEGSFRLKDIEPGTYTLEIRAVPAVPPRPYTRTEYPEPGQQKPARSSETLRPGTPLVTTVHERTVEVLPAPGEESVRLAVVDLRGSLKRIQIRCVDANGQPVAGALLSHAPSPDVPKYMQRTAPPRETSSFEEGLVALLLPSDGSADYRVTAEGYVTQDLRSVSSDTTVVLEQPLRVRVEVQVDGSIQAPDRLAAALAPAGESNPGNDTVIDFLDEADATELVVASAGDYELRLYLVGETETATHRIQLGAGGRPVTVTGRTRGTSDVRQVIHVKAESADLERAVERMQQARER